MKVRRGKKNELSNRAANLFSQRIRADSGVVLFPFGAEPPDDLKLDRVQAPVLY